MSQTRQIDVDFWGLALVRVEDYARAGVPMLPVVASACRRMRCSDEAGHG